MLNIFESAYLQSWLVYLASAIILFVVIWKITAWMGDFFKKLVRGIVAVLVLTPFFTASSLAWLKPAFPVAGYEFLFGDMQTAQDAFRAILIAFTVVIALLLLETVVRIFVLERESADTGRD